MIIKAYIILFDNNTKQEQRQRMMASTSSDLRDETHRPTAFLREHKFLIASYRAGMYVLNGQLNKALRARRSVESTVIRLFGETRRDQAKDMDVFPVMMALEAQTNGFLDATDEQITVAIKADVSALFVRVRDVADEAIVQLRDFVFDNPNASKRRKHITSDATKRCTDYFDRHSAARKEMEELEKLCDDVLWFTQLATVHKLEVPP